MVLIWGICIAISYLLGSCPFGYIVSSANGIDIRQHGSGNIGATNVLRILGKRWGYLVFALDALKGVCAVRLAIFLGSRFGAGSVGLLAVACAVTCILGHTFPIWLKFRGGKGVATSAGVILGLMPLAVVSVFLVWVAAYKMTRYVSVASIAGAISLPIFVFIYQRIGWITGAGLLPFSILIAAVVIWRHRSNLRRLSRGTEQRFDQK